MPDFSTSRSVRADYFGRDADNASFFNVPINVPNGTGPNQGRFGTLGRSKFRGPGFHNFNVAMIKDTPFGQRDSAEFGTLEFSRRVLQRRELRTPIEQSSAAAASTLSARRQDRRARLSSR